MFGPRWLSIPFAIWHVHCLRWTSQTLHQNYVIVEETAHVLAVTNASRFGFFFFFFLCVCLARASLEGSAGAVVAVHATFRCAIHLAFSLFFLPQKNVHVQNAHALTLHVRAQGMALFYSTLSGVQVQCLVFRPGIALSGGRHRRRSLARVFCSATVRLAPSPNKMKYNKNLSQLKRQEKAKKGLLGCSRSCTGTLHMFKSPSSGAYDNSHTLH